MRNLKRALSLALATVMTLGLMVVGTGAVGYDDVTSEENVEAIEVLQAVGIMSGVSDTEFDPDGLVTRNQMAVIMSQLLNLDYDYYRGVNPFSDVPAWAAPYVAACAAEGVTAGVGNGLYNGEGQVTAAQAALMILKALGYFQYEADFDGDWQIATIRQASYIGLFSGIDSTAEQALTRNQIAQLVLNGLKADMVYFTGDVGITVGEVVVGHKTQYTSRTSADKQYNAMIGGATDIAENDQYLIQLGEELYNGDLRLRGSTDNFGRPATTWRYDGRDIGTYTDDPDLTYTASVKSGEIYADLGLSESVVASKVTVYVDGDEQDDSVAIRRNSETKISDSGNGVLTEVWYDDEAETVLITHVNTYVGTVVRTVEDEDEPTYVIIAPEVAINGIAAPISSGEEFETDEEFADDQYVLYTYSESADEIQSVAAAEELNGVVTRAENAVKNVDDAKALTIDGERYVDSKMVAGEELGDISVDEEYTVYLDSYGYLIYVERIDEIGDYALLYRTSSGSWNEADQAFLIFADGTKARVDTAKDYSDPENLNYVDTDGDLFPSSAWDGSEDYAHDPVIVTYRVDEDGVYTLRAVASEQSDGSYNITVKKTAQDEFDLTNDKAGIVIDSSTTVRANSATTFVVREADAITNGSNDASHTSSAPYGLNTSPDWTAYTGIKAAPTIQSGVGDGNSTIDNEEEVNVYYYCKNSNMVTIMFIVPGEDVLVDDGNNSALYLSAESVSNLIHDKDGDYFEYQAVVDNEITTVRVSETATVIDADNDPISVATLNRGALGDHIYERYSFNSDGIIDRLEMYDDEDEYAAYLNPNGEEAGYGEYTGIARTSEDYTVVLGYNPPASNPTYDLTITVDEEANIYYVKDNGDITESSYGAIAIDNDDEILFIADDYMIQTLVIIQKGDEDSAGGTVAVTGGKSVLVGDKDVVLTATATPDTKRDEVVSYQWYRSTNSTLANVAALNAAVAASTAERIAGATEETYTVSTDEVSSYYYYCVVEFYNDRADKDDTAYELDTAGEQVTVSAVPDAPMYVTINYVENGKLISNEIKSYDEDDATAGIVTVAGTAPDGYEFVAATSKQYRFSAGAEYEFDLEVAVATYTVSLDTTNLSGATATIKGTTTVNHGGDLSVEIEVTKDVGGSFGGNITATPADFGDAVTDGQGETSPYTMTVQLTEVTSDVVITVSNT